MFFLKRQLEKNIQKHKNIKKTNILLFSADILAYKLTFVGFFYVFFCTFPKGKSSEKSDQLKNSLYLSHSVSWLRLYIWWSTVRYLACPGAAVNQLPDLRIFLDLLASRSNALIVTPYRDPNPIQKVEY